MRVYFLKSLIKKSATTKDDGAWSRHSTRWTPRCSSTTRPREGLIFCTSVTQCPHAPTSRNFRLHRCSVWSTPKEPQVCLGAHNFFRHKGSWATGGTVRSHRLVFHSTCDVRAQFVGLKEPRRHRAALHAECVLLLFADRVCTAMPLSPSRTPPYRAHLRHAPPPP